MSLTTHARPRRFLSAWLPPTLMTVLAAALLAGCASTSPEPVPAADPSVAPADVVTTRTADVSPFLCARPERADAEEPVFVTELYSPDMLPQRVGDHIATLDAVEAPEGRDTGVTTEDLSDVLFDDHAYEAQILRMVRHFTGEAVWDVPGVSIELIEDGLLVRQTPAVQEVLRQLLAAISTVPMDVLVEMRCQIVGVKPGGMAVFQSLAPLADGDLLHAIVSRAELDALLGTLEAAMAAEVLTAPVVSAFAAQAASISVVSQAAYVSHYETNAVESGEPIHDPVIQTHTSGLAISLRALPLLDTDDRTVVQFSFELAPRHPMLTYPLDGGARTAQAPIGGRTRATGGASISSEDALVLLMPGAVEVTASGDGHQFMLAVIEVRPIHLSEAE